MSKKIDFQRLNQERTDLNELLKQEDEFFQNFANLETETYQANDALDKKTKELIGLTISLTTRCDECIIYHLQECKKAGVTRAEIIEVIKLAIIGSGSVLYPNARLAIKTIDQLEL
ncbi:carboxymuconolactone decarboxylase family protein [Enterococcus pseudoavium]|uniref:Carboxymuconolactone decarboxylase family protein n=1 Tax=Enterococcus pseudoavium TaxID=44007 RepID=A0AAE4I195_9ENTE|nr:carboxymuconolactone decarboxylase family protein [Enterococcus pseudoavium]MDT2736582.1 carboxymuconolactone decarboxylase family protein [Enterococcus pseudoavium]REC31753.1 carboxymuconolactone decarboxylase family protein [Enterococcus pseudoavium]